MHIARRHVIGVERDEWDVEYVAVYSIARGEN
jgi:hypothetical protein